MVRSIAGRERVLANEEDCRVEVLGLPGPADAIVPGRLVHFDLKSGVKRNYREQMAAYALALMESQFASSWTAHLLYCDLREVETIRFTYEEAFELVDRTVQAFNDPRKLASANHLDSRFKLLETCFQPDEFVSIAQGAENEYGDVKPRGGVTLTASEWKKRAAGKGGIERCFSTQLGLFVRINPMFKDGTRNEDVEVFRHALVEFDEDQEKNRIPREEQLRVIIESGLPVSVLIDSGNKSLHAWIRVDAPDAAEYNRRVDVIWKTLEGKHIDRQNRNPSRLSRCPEA